MAIAATLRATLADDSNATSYATGLYTPTANTLLLAAVTSSNASGADQPTLSGNNLTWVAINTITFNTIASPTYRTTVFRAMGALPILGALTADFGAQTQRGCIISVVEFSETDTSGTNGSGAIVQSDTAAVDTNSVVSKTLAAFGNTNNRPYGAVGQGNSKAINPASGFTELHDLTHANPTSGQETNWHETSAATTVSGTTSDSTNQDMGLVALEIKAASGALSISVADSVTVSDARTVIINPLVPSRSDSITVSESASLVINPLVPSQADSVTIAESVTVVINPLVPSIADSVTVADNTTVSLSDVGSLSISVADSVTASDAITVIVNPLVPSIADSITIVDSTAQVVNPLVPSISDSIAISDGITVSLSGLAVLSIDVADSINVNDYQQIGFSQFNPSRGSRIRFLFNNLIDGNNVSLAASSQSGTKVVTRIRDALIKRTWRTTGITSENVVIDLGTSPGLVNCFAVAELNLSATATITIAYSHDNVSYATITTVNVSSESGTGFGQLGFGSGGFGGIGTDLPLIGRAFDAYFANTTARYWKITFADANNTDGYLDIGRIYLGEYFEPTDHISRGWRIEVVDETQISKTLGGQKNNNNKNVYLRAHFTLPHFSENEALSTWITLVRTHRMTQNDLFLSMFPDKDEFIRAKTTIYGVVTSLPQLSHVGARKYSTGEVVFEESL